MESFWLCYGANYCNCKDDLGCIIGKFSKIILLFFGFYEAHVSNLQVVEFIVKCNLERGWRTEVTPVEFPWGNPIQPQYHLPELPRLNKSKIGFNWAGGAGWVKRAEVDWPQTYPSTISRSYAAGTDAHRHLSGGLRLIKSVIALRIK